MTAALFCPPPPPPQTPPKVPCPAFFQWFLLCGAYVLSRHCKIGTGFYQLSASVASGFRSAFGTDSGLPQLIIPEHITDNVSLF